MNRSLSGARYVVLLIICAASLATCSMRGCGPRPRTVQFGNLRAADTIKVVGTGGKVHSVIKERGRLDAAISFIQQREDGWIDNWSGPRAPYLLFEFYSGNESLGHFGIAPAYLVAGSLSRDTPPEQITALAHQLGLRWPSS